MIIPYAEANGIRERLGNGRLVFTNGCFDLLHAGHVRYLEEARKNGDLLVVGLNGDESVRGLKGQGRPINNESDRAIVLAGLRSVDAVIVFPEKRTTALIQALRPDVYVKGADYTVDSLDPEERAALEDLQCEIAFVPLLTGRSTTATLAKLQGSAG